MTDENTEYRTDEAVVSETPGNDAPMTTEAMAGLAAVNADPLADPAVKQETHERAMFERYVADQGQEIPENFKDAASWFDSLKGAQAKYTQTQQEIAGMKDQYEKSGNTNNPDYVEPTSAPPDTPASPVADVPPTEELMKELVIPVEEPKAAVDTASEEVAAQPSGFSGTDYDSWRKEIAMTGSLSNETREAMKLKDFTESQANALLATEKIVREQAFTTASEIVGSGEKLSQVLRWAGNNFSGGQLTGLQEGLAGPNAELTLRGLAAAYDTSNANAEPKVKVDAVTSATAQPTRMPGYKSMQEYNMDMSNPRFRRDDKFRKAVEMRAATTDWRTLG